MRAEIYERHYWFRHRYVPWIQTLLPLDGARILEIGSGNGSSTVPLAEAGAVIDAVDVEPQAHPVLRRRAELIGVSDLITTHTANACDLGAVFADRAFDVILFLASLEHMTFDERIASLRSAWAILRPGQLLIVADTPNRLWYFDGHTAMDRYFHWLPDDVAIAFAGSTPRPGFEDELRSERPEESLARLGRGVSFHDFTIAFGADVSEYYVSGEWDHRRRTDEDYWQSWLATPDGRFHQFLKSISPEIPTGFLESELALCLRKP